MTTSVLSFPKMLLLVFGAMLICCQSIAGPTGRTNIVVMLADDLGFGDVEYQSTDENRGARTPNINAMAKSNNALQFNNFHSASSVCSPTRAAIVSGLHPDKVCVSGANAKQDLPGRPYKDTFPFKEGMPSIARDAQLAGYATGFFGKWHIGPLNSRGPGKLGFDHWIASPGNIPTYDPDCLRREAACEAHCTPDWMGNQCVRYGQRGRHCTSSYTRDNCHVGHYGTPLRFSQAWSSDYWTAELDAQGVWGKLRTVNMTDKPTATALTDHFEMFVKSVPNEKPLFAFLWFNEPHHPFIASPQLADECMKGLACKSKSDTITEDVDYFGSIIAVDRAVGRVRQILKDTGRYPNTILIFTSDNGPENPAGDGAGTTSPYRAYKGTVYEGAHRVPGIIEWPRQVVVNAIIKELASSLDFAKTFRDLFLAENLELKGLTQDTIARDGVSLLPLLMAKYKVQWTRPEPWGVCQPIQDSRGFCEMFAYAQGKWKIVSKRWGAYSRYTSSSMQLYNTEDDPLERNNLATVETEIFNKLKLPAIDWVVNVTNEYNRSGCAMLRRS
jgi:arylsulfatase A-like enzyme